MKNMLCTLVKYIHYLYHFSDLAFDIIDETLNYFKANVFFKNYEIKVVIDDYMVISYNALWRV